MFQTVQESRKVPISNAMLEETTAVIDNLTSSEKMYLPWFSYRVRLCGLLSACFRCLCFDCRVADCRSKDCVCSLLTEWPYAVIRFTDEMYVPTGQKLMFPIYAGKVATVNARYSHRLLQLKCDLGQHMHILAQY